MECGEIMKVPLDLIGNEKDWIQKQVFITKYIEQTPSKIYTEVKENLLVIVLKGKKHLVYKDFETTICEGQFALFKKGNYIMNQILSEGLYESLLIFLSDDLLRSIPRENIMVHDGKEKIYFKGNTVPYMEQEVNAILALIQEQVDYSEIIRLKIIELLIHIQKLDKEGEFEALLTSFSQEKTFQEEVIFKYDQYHNLEEIAAAMNMSLSTFKRRFQKEFKCTPHYWINERKLMKANMLLDTSDYSITDIGFMCGFESLSTFMLVFKKKYGVSPGQYRLAGMRNK
ncbi:MAG: helix-turn-helix transcriptional regulator [Cellulosilyticum sp.]|nr:helix-turn-helix transcriptional regulator [Cellulosilyticum sp.]